MNTEELQTLEIPLSKLLARNDNVRTTGVEEGIGELANPSQRWAYCKAWL